MKSSWATKFLLYPSKHLLSPEQLTATEVTPAPAACQALSRKLKQHPLPENTVGVILHPPAPKYYYPHKNNGSWRGGKGRKRTYGTLQQSDTSKSYPGSKPAKKDHTCHGPHKNRFQESSRLQQPKYMPDSAHHYSCKIREHDIFTAVINTLISPKHWHYQKAFTVAKSKNVCNPSIELSQRLFWELFRGKRFIRYATGYKNKANSSFHVRNKLIHGHNNSNTIIIATQAPQTTLCHRSSLLYKTDQYAKNSNKGR